MKLNTLCIHTSDFSDKNYPFGSVTVPIYQTATCTHPGIGETTGHNYTRESNPTRDELEKKITDLEGAFDTLACTSGMAAITIMLELFEKGDHIVCSGDLYGGSVRIFNTVGVKKGIEFTYIEGGKAEDFIKNIKENTKALFVETPSNPTMQITDLRAVSKAAKEKGILLIADNTFLTPYFQRPFEFGFDIVIHSGTKFLSGHNDTLAGFISVSNKELSDKLRFSYKSMGVGLSPFDSFLLIRGIKTLSVRLERQQENAIKIANWLSNHKHISKVYYVGLKEHEGYEINKSQTTGFGSMISFTTDTEERAREAFSKIKIISYAESLGGTETLMTFPMIQTHADVPVEIREKLGINEKFIRLSVGIEDIDDLISDLKQALE